MSTQPTDAEIARDVRNVAEALNHRFGRTTAYNAIYRATDGALGMLHNDLLVWIRAVRVQPGGVFFLSGRGGRRNRLGKKAMPFMGGPYPRGQAESFHSLERNGRPPLVPPAGREPAPRAARGPEATGATCRPA